MIALKNLLFTIVLPTYNRAHLITRAIQSVIEQEHTSWELLVIDDGSTDNTKEVVASFNDERIKYHWQENAERSAARNNGISLSIGDYICFLDSDDYMLHNHLSTLLNTIEQRHSPVALFFVGTICDKNGHLTKLIEQIPENAISPDWLFGHSVGAPRWCVHRDIFDEFLFDIRYRTGEDKELLMRISQKFPVIPVKAWTAVYTEHPRRSINVEPIQNSITHLQLTQKICSTYKSISRQTKRYALANAWFNLGRSHASARNIIAAVYSFIWANRFVFGYKVKRIIYLLVTSSDANQK